MKQIKILNAYGVTEMLSKNDRLSVDALLALFKLRKFLQPYIEFAEERQQTIIEKYKQFIDEKGNITGEPFNNYTVEISELMETDIEIDPFEKRTIILKDDMGITLQMMEALEPFIEFDK